MASANGPTQLYKRVVHQTMCWLPQSVCGTDWKDPEALTEHAYHRHVRTPQWRGDVAPSAIAEHALSTGHPVELSQSVMNDESIE